MVYSTYWKIHSNIFNWIMASANGTFPYKLWELINNSKDNGIKWNKSGNKVIIDKIPFQKHCLDTGKFKTKNFLSITKQLNVYGFVQCVHPHSDEFMVYKNKNFRKGHPELLKNFTRRTCYSRSKNDESVCESLVDSAKLTDQIRKKEPNKKKIDRVTAARLNFRLILNENLKYIMQLPTGLSSSENEDTDTDDNLEVPTGNVSRAPPQQDPRLLMWNGACIVPKPCFYYFHHQPSTIIHPVLPYPKPISACQLTAWDSMQTIEKFEETPTFEFSPELDGIFLKDSSKKEFSTFVKSL